MLSYEQQIKIEDHPYGFDNISSPFIISRPGQISFGKFKEAARWTMVQQIKYAAFIDFHSSEMEGKALGKLWALFKEMAEVVKSRNFRQCKSFHQKMMLEYKSIAGILSWLSKSCPKFEFLFSLQKDKLIHSEAPFQNIETNESFCKFTHDDMIANLHTDESYYPEQAQRAVPFFNSFGRFPRMTDVSNQKIGEKDQEWKECHQLFIEWTRRLGALLEPQSNS